MYDKKLSVNTTAPSTCYGRYGCVYYLSYTFTSFVSHAGLSESVTVLFLSLQYHRGLSGCFAPVLL